MFDQHYKRTPEIQPADRYAFYLRVRANRAQGYNPDATACRDGAGYRRVGAEFHPNYWLNTAVCEPRLYNLSRGRTAFTHNERPAHQLPQI